MKRARKNLQDFLAENGKSDSPGGTATPLSSYGEALGQEGVWCLNWATRLGGLYFLREELAR